MSIQSSLSAYKGEIDGWLKQKNYSSQTDVPKPLVVLLNRTVVIIVVVESHLKILNCELVKMMVVVVVVIFCVLIWIGKQIAKILSHQPSVSRLQTIKKILLPHR